MIAVMSLDFVSLNSKWPKKLFLKHLCALRDRNTHCSLKVKSKTPSEVKKKWHFFCKTFWSILIGSNWNPMNWHKYVVFLNTTNKTNFSSVFCLSFSVIFKFFSILCHVVFIFILIYLCTLLGQGLMWTKLASKSLIYWAWPWISDPTASPVYVV